MTFPRLLSINEWKHASRDMDEFSQESITKALGKVYSGVYLHDRFDALIDVYELCKRNADTQSRHLREAAADVMQHILNTTSIEELEDRILRRKKVREFDKAYMPWSRPKIFKEYENDPYLLLNNLGPESSSNEKDIKQFYQHIRSEGDLLKVSYLQSKDDEKSFVEIKYFNRKELEEYRVIPYQGKLIKLEFSGKGDDQHLSFNFFESSHLTIKIYDDLLRTKEDKKNRGIYAIHADGSIYAGPSVHPGRVGVMDYLVWKTQPLIHPSYGYKLNNEMAEEEHFVDDGLSPFMAGEIGNVLKGSVGEIDAASGHFLPSRVQDERSNLFLKEAGLIHNNTRGTFYDNKGVFTKLHLNANDRDLVLYVLTHEKSVSEKTLGYVRKFIAYNVIEALDEIKRLILKDIKDKAPNVYHAHQWQDSINQEYARWLSESKVIGSSPSQKFLELNAAVEKLSNYASIHNPEKSLQYLNDVMNAIDAWKQYHKDANLTSRREKAVNQLKLRMLEQLVHFELYILCKSSQSQPAVVNKFLQFTISIEELVDGLKKPQGTSLQLFSSNQVVQDELSMFIRQLDLSNLQVAHEQLSSQLQRHINVNKI